MRMQHSQQVWRIGQDSRGLKLRLLRIHVRNEKFRYAWTELIPDSEQLQCDGEDEGCVLSNGPNTEHSTDRDWACKHQEPKKGANEQYKPYRVDGSLGVRVNLLEPS
jgi:hypothetical protein